MGSARRFSRWVPILARDFRVVRADLRGHGATEIPNDGQLSIERLARDVVELADHLECEKLHLAGSSAGAIAAIQAALDYPERVETLASFAAMPGARNSQIDPEAWIARIRSVGLQRFLTDTIDDRFASGTDSGFIDWFVTEAARTDTEFLARFVRLMASLDQSARVHEIRCPTLAVVPGHDPLATKEQYGILRDRVLDCRFVVYEGLPHNITDAVPERCAEELRTFILDQS
jgi:3-oxoadipate enol-lactonase